MVKKKILGEKTRYLLFSFGNMLTILGSIMLAFSFTIETKDWTGVMGGISIAFGLFFQWIYNENSH